MPRVLKTYQQNILDTAYHFSQVVDEDDFQEVTFKEVEDTQDPTVEIIENATLEAEEIAQTIILQAKEQAKEILQNAEKQGYSVGYDKGIKQGELDGFSSGESQAFEQAEQKYNQSIGELLQIVDDLKRYKNQLEMEVSSGAARLAMTVAEKIINISLSTSTEVIEKMVLDVLEQSKNEQKIKVYISDFQSKLLAECDRDILDIISKKVEKVKIEVIENADIGTCIVEFDDKIINASAKTQIQNIVEFIDG